MNLKASRTPSNIDDKYCIGKYQGHIGLVDTVLVKYRGHIGLVKILEKFFSKKMPIFGQKMVKNGHVW